MTRPTLAAAIGCTLAASATYYRSRVLLAAWRVGVMIGAWR